MADPSFVAAGTPNFTNSGSITPGVPAGTTTGDIMVAWVLAGGTSTETFPLGWTKFIETNNGSQQRLTVAWKLAGPAETDPEISGQGGDASGAIISIRDCDPVDPISTAFSTRANTANTTVTADDMTTLAANSLVLFCGGQTDTGSGTPSFSGYSGTDPTFTERVDFANSGSSHNVSIFGATGVRAAAGAIGSRTCTSTSSLPSNAALIGFKGVGGGGGGFQAAWARNSNVIIGAN